MRSILLIGTAVLTASNVYCQTLMTGRDHAVDSDVVLESAVEEVKATPADAVTAGRTAVKFVDDEVEIVVDGVESISNGDDALAAAKQAAAVQTAEAWVSSESILFRSYKIAPNVGKDMLAAGVKNENAQAVDVSGFFDGVDFPAGSSAFYRPEFNRLLVRQTLGNALAIEGILAEHHNAQRELMGHQVEIETKFVEVNQETLKELGFNWTLDNYNGGAIELINDRLFLPAGTELFSDGLRTAASAMDGGISDSIRLFRDGSLDVEVVITAMEQADDTDVLSAPHIVTRSGKTAVIRVGEERAVPKEFRVGSQQTSLYIEHTGWENEVMGVQLEVTPELRSENLIDLKLKPRVIDLIGYDDYQISPNNATMLPINGWQYSLALQQGRFPIVTESVDGVKNGVGALYDGIVDTFTGGEVTDVNDWAGYDQWFLDNSQGPNTDSSLSKGLIDSGYYDQRRQWDDDELIAVPSLHGKLPYFRIREIETEVTVSDGSTVGMGGLIYDKVETYRDKVPVLGSIPFVGRLFRSEGEKNVKRNLIIFVTATQVDVNGQRNADIALTR